MGRSSGFSCVVKRTISCTRLVPIGYTDCATVCRFTPNAAPIFRSDYQLKEGSLFIEYSSGPVGRNAKEAGTYQKTLLLALAFSPKHKRRIASLKLDPKKFRKVVDQHLGGVIYYINDDEGITYEVQSGKVDAIEYGPAKKHDHLYCGDTADQKVPPIRGV